MIFKTFTEEESTNIAKEFRNSKLDSTSFYKMKQKEWKVPRNFEIIGIDAYNRLFVKEK